MGQFEVECWKCKQVKPSLCMVNITPDITGPIPGVMKPLCEDCSATWPRPNFPIRTWPYRREDQDDLEAAAERMNRYLGSVGQ